ncbi:hypothetical protein T439DRAFT_325248 [Meredithblackwellia eburnea MCA 4105]
MHPKLQSNRILTALIQRQPLPLGPHHIRHLSSTRPSSSSSSLTSTSTSPIFFDKVTPIDSHGNQYDTIPAFRVLDGEGNVLHHLDQEWTDKLNAIGEHKLKKIYETMVMLPVMDTLLSSSQRQGRISFYMTCYGEEGAVVGSAAAWEPTDEVFAQYREVGVLMYRDYPLSNLIAQVFSSASDTATRGRQMPCHYGWDHFHTISSPLATQIPQAAGAAYALKRTPGREKSCVICYMGEGATSEGDFHAGMNMASVLGGPCVFFVRNNGFAISTPSSEQYRGDGIGARGPGYGIDTVRVDGNDPLAVYLACSEARRRAVQDQKPVLVEAMTYRVGHHSTSDDSSAYRSAATVESIKKLDSPLFRLRRYLESLPTPLWSSSLEESTKSKTKKIIMTAFQTAERESKPPLDEMWKDVFAATVGGEGREGMERPQREQRDELRRLVRKWGETKSWKRELERFQGGKDKFLEG